jgi:hypothetical protein
MKVGMSVHTTCHFYDSHRRPFLSNTGKGWSHTGTADRIPTELG